jgi:endonuclease III
MAAHLEFNSIIQQLEKLHGKPEPPKFDGPLEMLLWENVVYLADDKRRQEAFEALCDEVGMTEEDILAAPSKALLAVTQMAGILPENQVEKLQRIATLVQEEFDGDLNQVLKLPLAQAKRALQKFPGIGEPGAEKILLFCGAYPVLALESNGLRVLLRMGFGTEERNYAASYRSVKEALKTELQADCGWLIRAHQLLRLHGQEICRRTKPLCAACPLASGCQHYQKTKSVAG